MEIALNIIRNQVERTQRAYSCESMQEQVPSSERAHVDEDEDNAPRRRQQPPDRSVNGEHVNACCIPYTFCTTNVVRCCDGNGINTNRTPPQPPTARSFVRNTAQRTSAAAAAATSCIFNVRVCLSSIFLTRPLLLLSDARAHYASSLSPRACIMRVIPCRDFHTHTHAFHAPPPRPALLSFTQ